MNKRPERQWPLPLARQRPQTFPMGRAEPEDCHSASAGSSGTPNIRPSMTRFARLMEKRCRDSAPSPEKLSGTTPFFRCAPGWLRSDPKIFPTNHRDSTLLCPRPHRGDERLRYLQCDAKEGPRSPLVNIVGIQPLSVVPTESRRLATVGGLQGLTRSKPVKPPRTFGVQCDLWSPRLTTGDYQTVRSPYLGQKSGGSCQP